MKSLLFFFVVVWFAASVSGVAYLTRFELTPAEQTDYPSVFPVESHLERDAENPTLIFFAHPKCPCTRASLRELARLMADIDGKVKAYVVFIHPPGENYEWADTSLRTQAAAIANVHVLIDEGNRETNIFGAKTSSLTLLYDRSGNLRFNGSITAARGHEGDNAGRSAIYNIVMVDGEKQGETFVFGCPLHKKDCQGESVQRAE